jgi:hypothetical protein
MAEKKNQKRIVVDPLWPLVEIYDKVLRIVAQKGPGHRCNPACRGAGHTYIHDFTPKPKMYGLADGSILIRSDDDEDVAKPREGNSEALYFAKMFYEDANGIPRTALENPPRSYNDLPNSAILDTQDVARRAHCSQLTVLRHANSRRLKIHPKSTGHDFYYRKQDVDAWLKQTSEFKRGRPRKEKQHNGK